MKPDNTQAHHMRRMEADNSVLVPKEEQTRDADKINIIQNQSKLQYLPATKALSTRIRW